MKRRLRWASSYKMPVLRMARIIATLVLLYVGWGLPMLCAQSGAYYEYDNYQPGMPYKSGSLGTLFNSAPHLITNVQTTYNGLQNVWTTSYLPFTEEEFNPNYALELNGLHYTTAIALSSPKNPLVGLYAPVQVCGATASDQAMKFNRHAFAADLPVGGLPFNYTGPFNSLFRLNKKDNAVMTEKTSEYGLSVFAAAQQFTRFGHEVLTDINNIGWNGFDKAGNVPMRIAVAQGTIPGFKVSCMIPDVESLGEIMIVPGNSARSVSRFVVGHETGHAILLHAYGVENMSNYSKSRQELEEGFCTILGHSFRLWTRPEKFTIMDWMADREIALPNEKYPLFSDLKLASKPVAYEGDYYQEDPLHPDYDIHTNGNVLQYWFYLINEGREGYVDDNPSRPLYKVSPLVPGDISATYNLALRILFSAFTTKLTSGANYHLLREATLGTAIEFGFLPGSHVYNQINNAWLAVNVGHVNNSSICEKTTALSMFDGEVQFDAQKVIFENNSSMSNLILLEDCSQDGKLSVVTSKHVPIMASDDDYLFSEKKDETESKIAVSHHTFGQLAKQFFFGHFGHGGYDVEYILGDETIIKSQIIQFDDKILFFVPFNDVEAVRDRILRNYFGIVNKVLKGGTGNPNLNGEHQILFAALANIFALEMKKNYETTIGNSDAEDIWTVGEDQSNPAAVNDFTNPKQYGQPAVYKGINWIDGKARNNAGFLHFFYYLLIHGTADSNGQDQGYTDPELAGKVYFVNKMDKELVLQVLWKAYGSIILNASIDEFRQATMTALHELDPVKYHPKSKEHIAFYDAWAAVLGLGDYASTLAHFPEDDAVVYPWAAKVGVEVEYPLYESYRLFEVSTSAAFNENVAPVYRFMNSQAPDLATGMTYGYINLEPGKYFVRSHLAQGPESRAHCEASDDPAFCESLLGKEKWTLPFPFTAGPVAAPVNISPLKGETMPAWVGFLSFGSVEGAMGYAIHVKDPEGTAAEHDIAVDKPYDEDDQSAVTQKLALSAKKPYSYSIAGKQKLGSEKAVHVLPGGLLQLLTDAEKEQFPTIYSDWTEEISFETDMPTITLKSPANGAKVPLFGEDVVLRSTRLSPDRADYYKFYLKEPFYESPANSEEVGSARFSVHVPGLQGVDDKKSYQWAIVPRKKTELPFILDEEEGEVAKWYEFIVDKDLAPQPEVDNIDCVEAESQPILHWKQVPGAQTYKVTGLDGVTQSVLGWYQTGQLAGKLANMSTFPNKYLYKVAAGVMGGNGEWIFGPEAVGDYSVHPPNPTNLIPNGNNNVTLDENQSVQLTWQMPAGLDAVDVRAQIKGESNLGEERVLGNTFNLGGLPFGKDIIWSLQAVSNSGCLGEEVLASFKTEEAPDEFDFGFELRVDNNDPKITGGFYHYTIKVVRPDGNIDFTGTGTADADTWQQVGFVPELGQVINGNELNGQLTDQQGDYLMELEIIDMAQCQNCADAHAKPEIKVRGMEYIRKNGESNWKLNKSVQPQPSDPVFPSRTIGAKKVIKLHYNLPN